MSWEAIRAYDYRAAFGRLRAGRAWRWSGVVVAGLVGGWLGLALGGEVVTPIGPADVTLGLSPQWEGETVVDVRPLGQLAFDTHDAPLRLQATISDIRLSAAEEMFADPEAINRMAAGIGSDLRAGVISLVVRALIAATLGAVLMGLLLFRSVWRSLFSGLVSLVVLVGSGALAASSFNPSAIAEPRYTGLIAGAPQVVGGAEAVVSRFNQYQEQLAGLVGNVAMIYEATSTLPVYEEDESVVRVLHVSDIQLNPASWSIIRTLREQYAVDVVVDSGDLTDRGSAAEDVFADEIADLEVPYVWVRGEHDSMGTQRAVESQPNAVVLDDDIEEVAGLTFYGAGDPRYTPDATRLNPDEAGVADQGEEQAEAVSRSGDEVDVAVLHTRTQGEAFDGVSPLVLTGSDHMRSTVLGEQGTRFLVQGSTGGAGLSGLDHGMGRPTPYQASVLYFDVETGRLQARDDIDLGGVGLTSAQVERHVEPDPDRVVGDEPEASEDDATEPERTP
ncbi:Icc-related predicted phosphoesterase [Nocardiopsis sp. Huas11]|uniref:metallophosphoesterase family protein n=1 Tax=Nocardiopsis sp. Huas11 TaxID=2183912 RepID=UPI000EAFB9DE|nr:metallophosphoesterase [Nocardiopsis sp. Huas11]RKS07213.1 Icc-related predicted phosphoesterase [Nocardiopsis sp. Huas11]